jgi:Tfp pilus assembly protein PilF
MSLDRFQGEGDQDALRHAEEDLLRAVDLFPGCADAHSVLATVYTLQGERNKAKQAIDRYKQILEDRKP